ncbi:hypothetical protein V2G26_014877 [Clonostachys chloroleuca]|uniref:Uncharacterized protein n=2 Tax=Clonostachys TaxID=110564 RepID=A0AA35MCE5_9HYPO|nr:unnamed protein product [Clonostachys rosea f. rosea IK726]CAI6094526.1 unnamed protein product [Clonostachys chloroleuca]
MSDTQNTQTPQYEDAGGRPYIAASGSMPAVGDQVLYMAPEGQRGPYYIEKVIPPLSCTLCDASGRQVNGGAAVQISEIQIL